MPRPSGPVEESSPPAPGTPRYLAFLPEHAISEHRVVVVTRHDGDHGAEISTLAIFPDAPPADALADALNAMLRLQVTADQRLDAALEHAPVPVRAAVRELLPALAASREDPHALRVVQQLAAKGSYLLFPVTGCPAQCDVCGTCRDDCAGCGECADGGCDICLPVTVTPRTAAVLGHALAVLADEAYDYAYRTGVCPGGQPGPLGAVPACARRLEEWLLRRYARAFDDLASDLEAGRLPLPACTAEEIALDIAIRDAGRIHHDEDELVSSLEENLPGSRFDYHWDHLQDALFQDKDYEDFLYTRAPVPGDTAEQWFGEFGNIALRDPGRGFRR